MNTQPSTSDYEKKRDAAVSNALHQMRTRSLRDAPVYLQHISSAEHDLKQSIDNLVHQEVKNALDTYQHRMLKKNEELIIEARIDEVEWRATLIAAKSTLGVSEYEAFMTERELRRRDELRAQLKNKDGVSMFQQTDTLIQDFFTKADEFVEKIKERDETSTMGD